MESELRASSAPPPTRHSALASPLPSPTLTVITPPVPEHTDTCITIDFTEQQIEKPNKQEMERQTDALKAKIDEEIAVLPSEFLLNMNIEQQLTILNEQRDRMAEEEIERQIGLQMMLAMAQEEGIRAYEENVAHENNAVAAGGQHAMANRELDDAWRELTRTISEVVEVTGYPSLLDLNTRDEFRLENLQEELGIDVVSRLAFHFGDHTDINTRNRNMEQASEQQGLGYDANIDRDYQEAMWRRYEPTTENLFDEAAERQNAVALRTQYEELTERQSRDVTRNQFTEVTETQSEEAAGGQCEKATETQSEEATELQCVEATERQTEFVIQTQKSPPDV